MSYPIYSVPAGDVLPIFFSTYSGTTGASITMTGLAVTDIEIYKDGGTTQRASDAGYTLLDTDGIDVDGITGIHGFSIDTGDNTDAGFYTVGAWFHVVVSAVTVDGQTVSFIAAAFRLMAAEAVAAKPKVDVDAWLGTAAATPTVAGVPEVDLTHLAGSAVDQSGGLINANVKQVSGDATAADNAEAFFDGTGYAGTNNVIPTVTTLTNAPSDSSGVTTLLSRVPSGIFTGITSLAQWLGLIAGKQTGNSTARTELRATGAGSGTFDETTDSVEAIRDNMGTAQTGDTYARLGAPAGASVSADVAAVKAQTAAIETDTQDLQSRLPAALTGAGNIKADVLAISGDATAADNLESYTDGTEFLPVDAFKQKFAISGDQLTTYKPDGTTATAYSPKTLTTDAAADPVTGN